ncbi:fimbrial protein [Escherichia albertii]|uniref:F4 family fimbrial subunit n=1 Tax=Escherichia albertii TaxID=208962 RepID=UPI000C148D10|nr:fimbrial protein [Escherichia albertii]
MKKTLIALALATSAMASHSAMAATGGGWGDTGHNFELSGNITISSSKNVWEVFSGVSDDLGTANIDKGSKEVVFIAKNAIPVLGIRSVQNFFGQNGITPQISYGNDALNIDSFMSNKADFTLPVKDKISGAQLGVLKTKLYAGAHISEKNTEGTTGFHSAAFAIEAGDAFYGGLPKESGRVESESFPAAIKNIIPDIMDKYDSQNVKSSEPMTWRFSNILFKPMYSAYYGSGIQSGESITVTLNNVPEHDVSWTASLPITVTYM